MPSGRCRGCGRMTNSACSNWWEEKPEGIGVTTECYAVLLNGAWIRGCGYHNGDELTKTAADYIIANWEGELDG